MAVTTPNLFESVYVLIGAAPLRVQLQGGGDVLLIHHASLPEPTDPALRLKSSKGDQRQDWMDFPQATGNVYAKSASKWGAIIAVVSLT
jgi:hypothetical protein